MKYRQVAELLPALATDLVGCGEADKLATLERTARELCERARVWRVRVVIPCKAESISVPLTQGMCACRVLAVDRIEIDGVSIGHERCLAWSLWRDEAGCSALEFRTAPVPGHGWNFEADLTLAPGPGGMVPDWLIRDSGETMAAGARAILKRHAGKPYTDYRGAEQAEKEWRRGVAMAAQAGAMTVRRVR